MFIQKNKTNFFTREQGSIKKVYTQYISLISEETILPNFKLHIKIYHEYSEKLKEEYTIAIYWKFNSVNILSEKGITPNGHIVTKRASISWSPF